MSARAFKRRRAKVLLRDVAVQQWFQECCDRIAEELARAKRRDGERAGWPQFPWHLTVYGLHAGAPKEPTP